MEELRKITPTPYSKLQTEGIGALLDAVVHRSGEYDFWVAYPGEPFTKECRTTTIEELLMDGDERVEVWFRGVPLGVINLLAWPVLEGELPLSLLQDGEEECDVSTVDSLWSLDDLPDGMYGKMLAAFKAQGPRLRIEAVAGNEPYQSTVLLFAHGAKVECRYVWGELLSKLEEINLNATSEELGVLEADAAAWVEQRLGEEYCGVGARLTKSFEAKDFHLLMQWIAACQKELDNLEEQATHDLRAYLQERLAGVRQSKSDTDPCWKRPETFTEFRASGIEISQLWQPAPTDLPKPLDRLPAGLHATAAFLKGDVSYHTLNSRGELELYILCNDSTGILGVTWEFGTLGSPSSSPFEVDLAVYQTPGSPTFFPFAFDLNSARGRYEAAAFCEQQGLPVFAVTEQNGSYLAAYCRAVTHSEKARRHFRNSCRTLLGLPTAPPPPEEVSLEEIMSLGTAYAFERSALGPDSIINPAVLEVFGSLASDRSKLVRNGPFTLWTARSRMLNKANRWTEGVLVIVSPAFSVRTKGRSDRDPLLPQFEKLPGFIRAEDTHPLYEGAIPAYRYLNGQMYEVPQRDDLRQELGDTWEAMHHGAPRTNPYRA